MKKIEFKCKTITPMFMYGSDNKNKTPELRPSEFKGMMRFWWRAIRAEDDVEKLRKEEIEIFGGTGEKEGKSKITLRVKYNSLQTGKNLKGEYRLNWRFDRETKSLTGEDAGIGYLLYSTVLPRIEKEFVKYGFEFEIEIKALDKNSFAQAIASLWLSIFLGGFGTRARRGGGNIEIIDKQDDEDCKINFIPQTGTKEELKQWLEKNIEVIKSIIIPSTGTLKYSNLRNGKILIFDPKTSWKEALNFIGFEFKKFRENEKNKLWDMAAFGMPIMHGGFSMRIIPYGENDKPLSDRLSSPLIIKIIKTKNSYFPLVIQTKMKVEKVGKEIKSGFTWPEAKKGDIKDFNTGKLEEFLNILKNKGGVEVNL